MLSAAPWSLRGRSPGDQVSGRPAITSARRVCEQNHATGQARSAGSCGEWVLSLLTPLFRRSQSDRNSCRHRLRKHNQERGRRVPQPPDRRPKMALRRRSAPGMERISIGRAAPARSRFGCRSRAERAGQTMRLQCTTTDDARLSGIRRGGRSDVLCTKLRKYVPARCRIRGQDPARGEVIE
jgi:hypothetical protein